MSEEVEKGSDDQNTGNTQDQTTELAKLQAKLAETEANLEKARKGEKLNKRDSETLQELAGKFGGIDELRKLSSVLEAKDTELSTLKQSIATRDIDAALTAAFNEAGVTALGTALKVVDRSQVKFLDGKVDAESIKTVTEGLKKSDPVLFKASGTAPPVKRSGEGAVDGDFKTNLPKNKSMKDLMKYAEQNGIQTSY